MFSELKVLIICLQNDIEEIRQGIVSNIPEDSRDILGEHDIVVHVSWFVFCTVMVYLRYMSSHKYIASQASIET